MGPAPETAAKQSGTSVPAGSDVSADAALFESIVDGVHVVVVRTSNDRYKRRCYLSLAAADKAAERARERGDEAAVVLCRLTPVRAGWVR